MIEPNILFGKFIIGNIAKIYSTYYTRKTCETCGSFIKKGSGVLDFGCGRGEVTSALKKHLGCRVVGVDIQDTRTNYDFPFYLIDGENLPFEDESFDVVFIRYVLHHCPDPVSVLTEAKRMSRKKIIIYEDLAEGRFSNLFCKLHGLSFNFFLQPEFKKCRFNNALEWERIFNELNLKTVYKKSFFSGDTPFYPVRKIFFVLEKN